MGLKIAKLAIAKRKLKGAQAPLRVQAQPTKGRNQIVNRVVARKHSRPTRCLNPSVSKGNVIAKNAAHLAGAVVHAPRASRDGM